MAIPAKRNISFSILDKEGIERIHDASIHIMEKVGMRVGGERALKLFKENGASVTSQGLVKVPKSLVERALKTAPKELVLYNRAGEPFMTIDSRDAVYFGCHSDMLEIVDPFTGEVRDFMRADIQTMCKIADALQNIHFVLSVGIAKDVRPGIQSQISFLETVKNFSKTINFSTNDVGSLQEVIDMAAIVAGGMIACGRNLSYSITVNLSPLSTTRPRAWKSSISARKIAFRWSTCPTA